MVRHGLAKVLIGVKPPQTREKSANGFENLPLQGLASHSENFEGKLCCCCCYIMSSTYMYGRIKLIISLTMQGNFGVPLNNFKPKFVAFFVAAGMAFSVFFGCFVGRKLAKSTFPAALSVRNFVVFHTRSN